MLGLSSGFLRRFEGREGGCEWVDRLDCGAMGISIGLTSNHLVQSHRIRSLGLETVRL
jgi:hypothetical protein